MTFPPKIQSRHRKKEKENQTRLSSHYHTSTRSLTYTWNPPPKKPKFTGLHAPGSLIKVALSKVWMWQKLHHQNSSISCSLTIAFRPGNFNKTNIFSKEMDTSRYELYRLVLLFPPSALTFITNKLSFTLTPPNFHNKSTQIPPFENIYSGAETTGTFSKQMFLNSNERMFWIYC